MQSNRHMVVMAHVAALQHNCSLSVPCSLFCNVFVFHLQMMMTPLWTRRIARTCWSRPPWPAGP